MFVISRIGTLARALKPRASPLIKSVRNGGAWTYRSRPAEPDSNTKMKCTVLGTIFWYWVLWHMYYDYEHLLGHYKPPDASKWTDAELGIPADEED